MREDVLYRLCSRRTITPVSIAPLLQRSEAEAATILGRLAVDPPSMVERTRTGRAGGGPAYKLSGLALAALGPAVAYQVRSISDTDRKVIAHVGEYGKITNRTVHNLFDVTVHPANAIIDDLVRREVLVKTSVQQRGPGVEYGPGPKFPHRAQAGVRKPAITEAATLRDEGEA